jgi:hypothetical protein
VLVVVVVRDRQADDRDVVRLALEEEHRDAAAEHRHAHDIPVVGLPIANHDDNQHAPDENLRLQNLWDGIASYAAAMMGFEDRDLTPLRR